jgi:hypothetical protein
MRSCKIGKSKKLFQDTAACLATFYLGKRNHLLNLIGPGNPNLLSNLQVVRIFNAICLHKDRSYVRSLNFHANPSEQIQFLSPLLQQLTSISFQNKPCNRWPFCI